jgi:hypothetical protein
VPLTRDYPQDVPIYGIKWEIVQRQGDYSAYFLYNEETMRLYFFYGRVYKGSEWTNPASIGWYNIDDNTYASFLSDSWFSWPYCYFSGINGYRPQNYIDGFMHVLV